MQVRDTADHRFRALLVPDHQFREHSRNFLGDGTVLMRIRRIAASGFADIAHSRSFWIVALWCTAAAMFNPLIGEQEPSSAGRSASLGNRTFQEIRIDPGASVAQTGHFN